MLSGIASSTPLSSTLGGGCTAAAIGSGSANMANKPLESLDDFALFCRGANGNVGASGAASNSHSKRAAVQHSQATANNSSQPEKRLSVLTMGFKLAVISGI